MKRLLHTLTIFCFALSTLQAQFVADETKYKLVKSIEVKARLISTDKLQNVFVVDEKGEVIKYNPKGEELARYNEFTLGMPSHIDATNPFQILLFYPEYMTVVTLDNTMSKISAFDFFDFDLNAVDQVCFSNDGHIWLYDADETKLKKINKFNKILATSDVLYFVTDKNINPNYLLERNNQVFVNDPEIGILIFDIYGQYIRTLPILGLESLQVLGQQLVYYKEKELHALHLTALDDKTILLPEYAGDAHLVRLEKSRIFVAGEKQLDVYEY